MCFPNCLYYFFVNRQFRSVLALDCEFKHIFEIRYEILCSFSRNVISVK